MLPDFLNSAASRNIPHAGAAARTPADLSRWRLFPLFGDDDYALSTGRRENAGIQNKSELPRNRDVGLETASSWEMCALPYSPPTVGDSVRCVRMLSSRAARSRVTPFPMAGSLIHFLAPFENQIYNRAARLTLVDNCPLPISG